MILISGGTDGGARTVLLEMLILLREALSLMPLGNRPVVLYAGNSSLAASARETLSQLVEVLVAPNIRQGDGESLEPLQAVLESYFDEAKRHSRSFQHCAAMSDSGIMPSARGSETMTVFFSRATGADALTVDVGGAKTMLSLGREGRISTAMRNDIGLGHSAAAALEIIGEYEISHWLPFHPRKGELSQYARNKGLRAASLPLDMRERYIEYALLRAGIRYVARELPQFDRARVGLVMLAGGCLTEGGQGALEMMLLADALQLEGAVQVKADPHGRIAGPGRLGRHPSGGGRAIGERQCAGARRHAASGFRAGPRRNERRQGQGAARKWRPF